LLAGKIDEAIPFLRKATTRCVGMLAPFQQTHAHLWLGQALETKGDTKGACSAYKVVLDRWGNAKPKSLTADQARVRTTALACK